jgi:hypothetical protein
MADKFGVLLLGKALDPAYLLCVPGGGGCRRGAGQGLWPHLVSTWFPVAAATPWFVGGHRTHSWYVWSMGSAMQHSYIEAWQKQWSSSWIRTTAG